MFKYFTIIIVIFLVSNNLISAPSSDTDRSVLLSGTQSKFAEIFNNRCVSCHSGGVAKAAHLTTFQVMSADYILNTLNGVMSAQAEGLSEEEKIGISEYITGGKVLTSLPEPKFCKRNKSKIRLKQDNSYPEWGYDKENSRYALSNINSENAHKLKLKWAFAYPSATRARSQPSISGNAIFVGGQNLYLYALSRDEGCVIWRTKVDGEIRSAPSIYFSKKGNYIFAGDYEGNLYKIDPYNGNIFWKKSLRYHPRVILTGSVRVDNDVVYVPLSSREWADGADPEYECCSFRGGIMALSIDDGSELWTSYSIPLPAKHTGKFNNNGKKILAPSGVPVWNSPTFDLSRNLIYYGTGESYSSPAADTSDAIIAIDKFSGEIEWVYQAETGDAWNMGCFVEADANCPEEDGPDWDFGASVVLADIDGKNILFAGRKSGHVYALDPDNKGKPLWIKRIGKGGFLGGVHWGMTTDNKSIFAPIADTNLINKFPGKPSPGIYSLDGLTGKINWKFTPIDRCAEEQKPACDVGISASLSSTNDLVIGGGLDGWIYVLDKNNGKLLWEFNTNSDISNLAGIKAHGGSIESDGPVVLDNNIFINSGYLYGGRLGGNVLLNFELD